MKHILIVDDDLHIGNVLEELLSGEGYLVSRAYSGTEAVLFLSKALPGKRPDLILLDLMLPGIGGDEVLSHIRDIPVIVMSARGDVDDKVSLLMAGAVDYVTKPFDTKELLARISVHLRTYAAGGRAEVLHFDDIELHMDVHTVYVEGREIRLTRTEYAILKMLMQNQAQIVTKSLLLERMSEDTPDCTESSLKVHISNLRKKLRNAGSKDYIEAVWGIGFRLKSGES